MKTVLVVFGTRPEAIKMCPLVHKLKKKAELHTLVCITGQHREMLTDVLDCFGVVPDFRLDVFRDGQSLTDLNAAILKEVGALLSQCAPDAVMVHGDTATAFASALAAFFLKIPVFHVEAGLRSQRLDAPFPEEMNRCAISLVSAVDFAPTESAKENLLACGKAPSQVYVTGNTVIDALKTTVEENFMHPLLEGLNEKTVLLLTCHRRENLGEPIRRIFHAVLRIADMFPEVRVICPIHRNPLVRDAEREIFGERKHPHVFITEPLGTVLCHNLMARSKVILTDSGGLQEEAPALGKPVIVLREHTERPEGVAAGNAILCGSDEEKIVAEVSRLLTDEEYYHRISCVRTLYGDGTASDQIADIVEDILSIGDTLP